MATSLFPTPDFPTLPDYQAATVLTGTDAIVPARGISWDQTKTTSGALIPAGSLSADCIMEERSEDESILTENPIEQGSVITDHAFDLPQELDLQYIWSPSAKPSDTNGQPRSLTFLQDIYSQLLKLKQNKILLNVSTGKRNYESMLIKGLSQTTDGTTENILAIRVSLRQVIITYTQGGTQPGSASTPASAMSLPASTMNTVNRGTVALAPGTNFNATYYDGTNFTSGPAF